MAATNKFVSDQLFPEKATLGNQYTLNENYANGIYTALFLFTPRRQSNQLVVTQDREWPKQYKVATPNGERILTGLPNSKSIKKIILNQSLEVIGNNDAKMTHSIIIQEKYGATALLSSSGELNLDKLLNEEYSPDELQSIITSKDRVLILSHPNSSNTTDLLDNRWGKGKSSTPFLVLAAYLQGLKTRIQGSSMKTLATQQSMPL